MHTSIARIYCLEVSISGSRPYAIRAHRWGPWLLIEMRLLPEGFLVHASAMVAFSSTVIGRSMRNRAEESSPLPILITSGDRLHWPRRLARSTSRREHSVAG